MATKLPRKDSEVTLGKSTYRVLGTESNGPGSWMTRLVKIGGRGKLGGVIVADYREVLDAQRVEREAKQYPDLSWLVPGNGAYLCRPCRLQFHSVDASRHHDDEVHPERVALRRTVTA